jgi:hypothetical protein
MKKGYHTHRSNKGCVVHRGIFMKKIIIIISHCSAEQTTIIQIQG